MEYEKLKVLLIEDEDSIRKFTAINLKRNNFEVYESKSGEEGLEKIDEIMPEVVILDIMLPGIDGFGVCSRIREAYPEVIIIILTARGQDMDRIMGLDLGADDYMVKPFNPLELAARIRAILRRSNKENKTSRTEVIHSGRLTMDLKSQRVYKDDTYIEVTPREFALIRVFLENPGSALSRDELLDMAWGKDFFGDYKTVDVHVRRLREKLEDDPAKPMFIQTVWGHGYRYQGVK